MKISSYAVLSNPQLGDKLIGTDVNNMDVTKNFTIQSLLDLLPSAVLTLPTYASNAAALVGGLVVGQLYKSSAGVVSIVI
jgi:hypothetical protein